MPFSRRGFLKAATLGAIAESDLCFGVLGFATETLPSSPRLVDAEKSRSSSHLDLSWEAADGVQYDLRIDSISGSEIRKGLKPPVRLEGLVPNRDYSVSVASADSANWSSTFKTCTRPPTPDALKSGFQDMTSSGITVKWDFTSVAKVADRPATISVSVGRVDGGGKVTVVKRLLPQSGSFIASGVETYIARLVSPNRLAPDYENESEWGPPCVLRKASFGLLKTPGRGLYLGHRLPYNITHFRP